MGRPLPVRQKILRAWRAGCCRFTKVRVNEHPQIDGVISEIEGEIAHHDSPDLHHWLEKQNRYSTAEALAAFTNASMAAQPKIFGSTLERRMWLKKYFRYLPFRFIALFLYLYIGCGCWRVGWSGYAWSKLRSDVMRFREFKRKEMELTGKPAEYRKYGAGFPDKRVPQF